MVSESNSSITGWDAIGKIIEYNNYIYIYSSAVTAYIIPNLVFNNLTDKQEFLNLTTSYIQNS
jgi:hypothetical protein